MPEIELMSAGSKAFVPVTVMPAMVYVLGYFALKISIKAGLTETGMLSF
jgi:hypothetical protein